MRCSENKQDKHMKKQLALLLALTAFCSLRAIAQIAMTVDSLTLDETVWISRNDVVIEDFAYGPCLRLVCSVANNTDDTVVIDIKNKVSFEFGKHKRVSKWVEVPGAFRDFTLSVLPHTQVCLRGSCWLYACLDKEEVRDEKYRVVSFLPAVTKVLNDARVVIGIEGSEPISAPVTNCFIGKSFFVEQTFGESIMDFGNKEE